MDADATEAAAPGARVAIDPAKLDALFEPYNRSDRPGVAVGVALGGRPFYRRGFGLASVELPVALSPTVRLRIGSTTKHFCALCIMLLAEDGKLSPQDSVRRHIPEIPQWADPITLASLMSHTSGVRCSLDILSSTSDIMQRPLPHAEQVKLLVNLESSNFAPGEDWMYSNGGYVLLTEVIRRLSGEPWEAFLKRRVLEPVGMCDTLARATDTELLPNSATLHVPTPEGGWSRGVFGPDIGGEGSMVSTVDDMLTWLKHMAHPVVGSAETWRAMTAPTSLRDGRSTGYGYGLATGPYRGLEVVQHGGVVVGGVCQMLTVRELGLDVILLANLAMDVTSLGERILDACVSGLDAAEAEPAPTPFPTGDFYSARSGRHLKLVEKDGAPAADFGGAVMPLKRRADGRLWIRTNLADGAFIAAKGDGLEITEFGATDHLAPVSAPEAPEALQVAGRYRAPEIGVSAVVQVEAEGGAHLRLSGALGAMDYAMLAVAPGVWLLSHPKSSFGVILERDGAALLLSSTRSRRMRLEPVA